VAEDDKPTVTREQVQAALRASMNGTATGADAAILAAVDHGRIIDRNRRETQKLDELSEFLASDPMDRARAWVGDALIFCPLPFRRAKDKQVIRRARTGSGEELEVIYSATGKAPLPFGEDAFLLDLLVSEARKLKSPEVTFDSLKELIRFLGGSDGGTDYRRLRERIDRIAGLHIRIERKESVRVNVRVVDVQNVEDISNKKTQLLEAEYGQRRLLPYAFRFAPEFYEDLMRYYTVIPLQILRAFSGSPIEYSIARWLYRRIIHAQRYALVPWAEIHAERSGTDSNPRRIRAYARNVVQRLKVVWPGLDTAVDERNPDGLLIKRAVAPLIPDRLALGKPS
jgi:hypothetical protein